MGSMTQSCMTQRWIFVDLDETLICGDRTFGTTPKNAASRVFGDGCRYHARLRPGALEMLTKLREMGPVFILTAANTEWSNTWNEAFNLGFKSDEIYSRDDTPGCHLIKPTGNCTLIDNLPAWSSNSEEKIRFLKEIGPMNYIHIAEYNGYDNQAWTEEKIAGIVAKIK